MASVKTRDVTTGAASSNYSGDSSGNGPLARYSGLGRNDVDKIMSGIEINSGGAGAAMFAKGLADQGIAYIYGAGRSRSAQLNGATAYDCSSFVAFVVNKTYGIPISKFGGTVELQWRYMKGGGGIPIRYDEAEPGDILFMWTTGGILPSHVGIATGNGNMVHASGGQHRGGYKAGNTGVISAKMMSSAKTNVYRLKSSGSSAAQNITTPSYSQMASNPVSSALSTMVTPQASSIASKKKIAIVEAKATAALAAASKPPAVPSSNIVKGTASLSSITSLDA
jgi:cell wall-associated NlpC family hydrolase